MPTLDFKASTKVAVEVDCDVDVDNFDADLVVGQMAKDLVLAELEFTHLTTKDMGNY